MCFKKKTIDWPHHPRVALLFGKNNTHYGSNKLSFCVNDIDLVKATLTPYDFQFRYFADADVTRKNFREQLIYAFTHALSGDIIYIKYSGHGSYEKDLSGDEIDGYDETLYMDGNFSDDETAELTKLIPEGVVVIFSLDCCYSGTSTREMTPARFMPPKEDYPHHRQSRRIFRSVLNHIVFSGCSENEVSEEAVINGTGNGIFTYYEMEPIRDAMPGLTYRKWFDQIQVMLPNKNFKQTPRVEGPDSLLDRLIFQ